MKMDGQMEVFLLKDGRRQAISLENLKDIGKSFEDVLVVSTWAALHIFPLHPEQFKTEN